MKNRFWVECSEFSSLNSLEFYTQQSTIFLSLLLCLNCLNWVSYPVQEKLKSSRSEHFLVLSPEINAHGGMGL